MKKGLGFLFIFLASLSISVIYQNCGQSSMKANSSDNGGLTVEVLPNGNDTTTGDETTGDPNKPFSYNLNNGDNVFYVTGGGLSLDLSTSRILSKIYYTLMESHVFEQAGVTFPRDLPNSYCANSALPHCAHLNNAPCLGYGCFAGTSPVRCHWQKRMSTADVNITFQALNEITFVNRKVSAQDPMIADCNDPNLYFYKENESLGLSLANRACVPDGQYYASQTSADGIKTIFNNELDSIKQLMDPTGGSEYCNNYSAYAWDTTKWRYQSNSGFSPPENSYHYEASYENQRVDLKWKEPGDTTLYCATGVPLQPAELDAFFPKSGLQYEIMRTQSAIVDAPTSEITFEDPVDGGLVWQLFLTRASALTNTGGAILDSTQASAIRDMIETVLVQRAKTNQMAQACP